MNIEKLELFLSANVEYAWLIVLFFAFLESFVISGAIVSSAVLFSICIFIYNADALPLSIMVPMAIIGAHLGDMSGFFFGKTLGPNLINSKFFQKRKKLIFKSQAFLDSRGPYAVIIGRFVPAIRPLVPFLLGVSDLKTLKFYLADITACIFWGLALGVLVTGVGSIFN